MTTYFRTPFLQTLQQYFPVHWQPHEATHFRKAISSVGVFTVEIVEYPFGATGKVTIQSKNSAGLILFETPNERGHKLEDVLRQCLEYLVEQKIALQTALP